MAPPSKPAAGPLVRDDLQAVFRQAGVRGTFAVLDVDRGQSTLVDRRRAGRRLIPLGRALLQRLGILPAS